MRAALVGASDFNGRHFAKQRFDAVIAVDGGYAHLQKAGVQPDFVVGDFDSLGYVPEAGDVRVFPPEKDQSDMQLACRAALQEGCDELVLYGCLGQRFDHTIANVQVMLAAARGGQRAYAIGDDHMLVVLHGQRENPAGLAFNAIPLDALQAEPYRNHLSAFALGGTARGVWEHGLKYDLDGVELRDDTSWGLSNEFTGAPAHVVVKEGSLLVVLPLAAWDYMQA